MRCEDLAERLTEFMEGNLEPEEEAAALEHLASCAHCETVLAETRDVLDLANQHGRIPLDHDTRGRMFQQISRSVDGAQRPS